MPNGTALEELRSLSRLKLKVPLSVAACWSARVVHTVAVPGITSRLCESSPTADLCALPLEVEWRLWSLVVGAGTK